MVHHNGVVAYEFARAMVGVVGYRVDLILVFPFLMFWPCSSSMSRIAHDIELLEIFGVLDIILPFIKKLISMVKIHCRNKVLRRRPIPKPTAFIRAIGLDPGLGCGQSSALGLGMPPA
jgi:hypothetical protein